jgi:hypothetical protein
MPWKCIHGTDCTDYALEVYTRYRLYRLCPGSVYTVYTLRRVYTVRWGGGLGCLVTRRPMLASDEELGGVRGGPGDEEGAERPARPGTCPCLPCGRSPSRRRLLQSPSSVLWAALFAGRGGGGGRGAAWHVCARHCARAMLAGWHRPRCFAELKCTPSMHSTRHSAAAGDSA